MFIVKWEESCEHNIATVQNYWHRKTWIMNSINTVLLLNEYESIHQGILPCFASFSKTLLETLTKANKCHDVGALEPWPSLLTKWVWLSKMAQVGARGLGKLRWPGWTFDVGRAPWSEVYSESDFILKGFLEPEEREFYSATPWCRARINCWDMVDVGVLAPCQGINLKHLMFNWALERKTWKNSRKNVVMLNTLKPCQSFITEWVNTYCSPLRLDILCFWGKW